MEYEQEFQDLYERDGLTWGGNGESRAPENELRNLLDVGYANLSQDGRCRAFRLMKVVMGELERLREREHLLARIEQLLSAAKEPAQTDTDLLMEEVANSEGALGGSSLGVRWGGGRDVDE